MAQIRVLDAETIDKIAAGEVVERPSSVVKELVENAIDAGADAITVEAKEGGIGFLRIADNGSGMEADQIRTAFLRHATSKIRRAEDLTNVGSLGFRGEALSSIAAVSQVEMITKTAEALTGVRYIIEGAVEKSYEEVGAPKGTTFIMRNLFFNTPVRRKFLKQAATEGGYIAELMEYLALSRPDISFKLILNNQMRFHTSGNGDLKEVIYRIYGREIAAALVPIRAERDGIRIEGYLGKPVLVRSNRNYEIYYINGRLIKSRVIAKAVEEGYKEYLMQHKFPFCVLHISMDPQRVDVNVHPNKMDVRFADGPGVMATIAAAVKEALSAGEMIPQIELGEGRTAEEKPASQTDIKSQTGIKPQSDAKPVIKPQSKVAELLLASKANTVQTQDPAQNANPVQKPVSVPEPYEYERLKQYRVAEEVKYQASEQLNLFEEKVLSPQNRPNYRIVGQVFDTYWMVEFEGKLLMIDQHAAHEKVKYEKLMKQYREKNVLSQGLLPPIVVTLNGQEEAVLHEHREVFESLGFDVEAFGGNEYTIRSVPVDLYGCNEKELFLEVLDTLLENGTGKWGDLKSVEEKIASMSCKAAVKGNNKISLKEAESLLDQLLVLDNPYHCPHGRPTIISMTKAELEKKFKRIL